MTRQRSSRRDFLRAGCGLLACGGAQALLPQLSLIPTALAGNTPPGGYKALVCLYLGGGNDAWNLLMPGDASAHAKYAAARNGIYNTASNTGGLALPHWSGTGFVSGQTPPLAHSIAGGQFGVNSFCPELAQLFNENRLAFLSNIGPLVEPITVAQFNGRRRPPQLYSHNDQTNLWNIGTGSSVQTTEGWGGRVAGRVALSNSLTAGLPPTITLSGQTRFLSGADLSSGNPLFSFALSTSSTSPATSLSSYRAQTSPTNPPANQFEGVRRAALRELLDAASPQAFTTEYGSIVERSLVLADEVINPAIVALNANTAHPVHGGGATGFTWPTGSGLSDQLRQIAKMIVVSTDPAVPRPINANRQVFYVNIGGFDTHDAQITGVGATGHHLLLQRVSQAVNAFYRAMVAIGRGNDVTLFSASEFARTINSNGNGSDHAWGSLQFAVGGAVNGGQVYGRYPTMVLNNSLNGSVSDNAAMGECFSRGQFLPTMAVDQFAATLTQWMGVANADLPLIFPNLDNFASGPFANAGATPTFAYFNRTIPGLMSGV
jgi:uncharacterized protein (DUF1501 family)